MLGWLMALLAAGPQEASAQTNATRLGPRGHRYLFIVETSRSMQRRADAVFNTVQELLSSAMKGQLRSNDTVALWTFNEDLHTGQLPLQRWSPGEQPAFLARVLAFLKDQTFEKRARLAKVLPAMDRVIRSSEFITVILISSGEEQLNGTPFDDRINEFYQSWRARQQQARMPFVTTLRAERGKVVDYRVAAMPWPVELPAVPAAEQKPAEDAPKAQPVVGQPLIVSGRKPEVTQPLKPAEPAPVPAPTPSPKPTEPAAASTGQAETSTVKHEPLSPEVAPLSGEGSQPMQSSAPVPVAGAKPQSSSAPPESLTEIGPAPVAAKPLATNAQPSPSLPTPSPAPPAKVAGVAPGGSSFDRAAVWLALAAGLAAVAAVLWSWRRVSRRTVRASLITRSLDRERPEGPSDGAAE